jgi:hypothetical protein
MMAPPDLRRTVSPIAKPMRAVPDAGQGVWHRQDMFQPFTGAVTIQTDPLPAQPMFSRTTGQARLALRPSKKSIKRVVEKVHELTVDER